MCGIAGLVDLERRPVRGLRRKLAAMNELQRHRGPDGQGVWTHDRGIAGFGHRRLSIIDLSSAASQPMTDGQGLWVTYNGEIYNYLELRKQLGVEKFRTTSDTEVILHAYRKWGEDCVSHFVGMFAFAVWDERKHKLFCARDRFGIKPFCYALVRGVFVFASEAKAILPFLSDVDTDEDALKDYLTFQFCLDGKSMFKGISELLPGHVLTVSRGKMSMRRYWEVYYDLDWQTTPSRFHERLRAMIVDSVSMHLRSDVPLGAYISGGVDSSIVAVLAGKHAKEPLMGFNGRFLEGKDYDESAYARVVAKTGRFTLKEVDITLKDFLANIRKLIWHMDYPVAGPGAFPQFMVSREASRHRKVLLGGQGGDEIFGGYVRYLIAYFEQCIRAAIEGTMKSGKFIVTYESIIPNLTSLKTYKPLLKEFWREGLFEAMDKRYFRLVDRTHFLGDEISWENLGSYSPYETFRSIFFGKNVGKESYFDQMTHFDFKTLLPALLHVEDRVSMAHGLESRVPLLHHPVVEYAATMPSNVKFSDGTMKCALKHAMKGVIPAAVAKRKDKMGFPVPLNQWLSGPARGFVRETLSSRKALSRRYVKNRKVVAAIDREPQYGRRLWGLLCLELWQCEFHDRSSEFRKMVS